MIIDSGGFAVGVGGYPEATTVPSSHLGLSWSMCRARHQAGDEIFTDQ